MCFQPAVVGRVREALFPHRQASSRTGSKVVVLLDRRESVYKEHDALLKLLPRVGDKFEEQDGGILIHQVSMQQYFLAVAVKGGIGQDTHYLVIHFSLHF